jgi:hypothetical protein
MNLNPGRNPQVMNQSLERTLDNCCACFVVKTVHHLGVGSDPWLPDAGPDGTPLAVPLSAGGPVPHFPSDSNGSITCTPPSLKPNANWFGSAGCAAITKGYTVDL